jgi:hypothetical protein
MLSGRAHLVGAISNQFSAEPRLQKPQALVNCVPIAFGVGRTFRSFAHGFSITSAMSQTATRSATLAM